jgi:hypothetical protein
MKICTYVNIEQKRQEWRYLETSGGGWLAPKVRYPANVSAFSWLAPSKLDTFSIHGRPVADRHIWSRICVIISDLVWCVNPLLMFCLCTYVLLIYNPETIHQIDPFSMYYIGRYQKHVELLPTQCSYLSLAAWSSGTVSTCHWGDWSYGSWDRIPPGYT